MFRPGKELCYRRRQRAAAGQAMAGLAGVRSVCNDIEISYDIARCTSMCTSRKRWTAWRWPAGSDVKAGTKDIVITLTGHVRTWAEHDAVPRRRAAGRRDVDVRDDLQVTG